MLKRGTTTLAAAAALAAGLSGEPAEADGFSLNLDFGNGRITIDDNGNVGGTIRGNGVTIRGGTGASGAFNVGNYDNGTQCRNAAARQLNSDRALRRDGHMAEGVPRENYRENMAACRRHDF